MHRQEHGQHVLFDHTQRDRVWDPVALEYIRPDEAMRKSWVTLCHERVRRLMISLAFLYRITGDERYSRWVWKGLKRSVSELYENPPGFELRGDARFTVVYGGLYEAQSVLQLVQAVQLVQDAPGASASDVDRVNESILQKVGAMLSEWMDVMPVHNMSCWAMSALAVVGRHLGKAEWVEKALYSTRNGLQKILRHGLPHAPGTGKPDGFWFETSTFYNFYAGIPLVALYRIGEAEGAVDPDLRERFHSFFEAPLHLVDSDLRLLTVGDRVAPGKLHLPQMRHVYEYAAGQVDFERYGPLLSLLYEACGAPRTSLAALAWGPDALPPACDPPGENAVLGAARLATFRKKTEREGVTLWFLGGGDGDPYEGHHHHDKLSFSLHAFGEIITSDLGRPSGIDRSPWSTMLSGTFSHNTLLVDETDQGPMKSLRFDAEMGAEVPRVRAAVTTDYYENRTKVLEALASRGHRVKEGVYEGVVLDRNLFFDFPYIILHDRCTAEEGRRFGFVCHACGSMVVEAQKGDADAPLGLPAVPSDGYWELFTGRGSADPVRQFIADWRIRNNLWLRLVVGSDAPFEATWGRSPGNPRSETRGTVLLRAPGKSRRFLAALEVHEGAPTLCGVASESQETIKVLKYDGSSRVYPGDEE